MSEGWELSLGISIGLPLLAVFIFVIFMGYDELSKRDNKKQDSFGMFYGVFGVTLLTPFMMFFCLLLLFPAVHSIVNLVFQIINSGFQVIYAEIGSGSLSLRICSVMLCFSTFNYLLKGSSVITLAQNEITELKKSQSPNDMYGIELNSALSEVENQPEYIYAKRAKLTGSMGNLFFCSIVFTLWIDQFIDLNSLAFPIVAWILLFVIDDWALLMHFKLEAAKTVTFDHNLRLYAAAIFIPAISAWGAYESNSWMAWLSTFVVILFSISFIYGLKKEQSALKNWIE